MWLHLLALPYAVPYALLVLALALALARDVRTAPAPPGAVSQIFKSPGGLCPGRRERSDPHPDRARRALIAPPAGRGERIESSAVTTQARMARSSSQDGGISGEGRAQGLRLPRMGAKPPPGSPRKPCARPDGKA